MPYIEDAEIENSVFVLDCGWSTDLLSRAQWAVSQTENISGVNPEFEIVIAGSSFPNSFSGMGTRHEFTINERLVFGEVRQKVNMANLSYGDWASTRPPVDPVPMRNIPRIDISQREDWLSIRSDGSESYEDLAIRTMNDDAWPEDLGIWGTYMIESTAEGLDSSIKSPAAASAVRINLHLHYQANFDNLEGLVAGDEPYQDDF